MLHIESFPTAKEVLVSNTNLSTLVKLGEVSQLKSDLNRGIASLFKASEGCHRPHLCLNGEKGVPNLKQIASNPDSANTEIWLTERFIVGSDRAWLNVGLSLCVDSICWPTNAASITPRQTSYIVTRLPEKSQREVLAFIKTWYEGHVLPDITSGLQAINAQLTTGNPLVKGTHDNYVFDLHGDGMGHDRVPYTELDIVGHNVAPAFLYGVTCFDDISRNEGGPDGYDRTDEFLVMNEQARSGAVEEVIKLFRGSVRRRSNDIWP